MRFMRMFHYPLFDSKHNNLVFNYKTVKNTSFKFIRNKVNQQLLLGLFYCKLLLLLLIKFKCFIFSFGNKNQISNFSQVCKQMSRNLRSVSFKTQILNSLHLDEIQSNPICSVTKKFRTKNNKIQRKPLITIREEITSFKSIKHIKPYKTEKIIRMEPSEYEISNVVKSDLYKKLQSKFFKMMTNFNKTRRQINSELKKLDKSIVEQQKRTGGLCDKLTQQDKTYNFLQNEYYQVRRRNYELRCELSERNGPDFPQLWNPRSEEAQQHFDIDSMTYQQVLQMEERIGKENIGLKSELIAKLKVEKLKDLVESRKDIVEKDQIPCCICCQNIESQHFVTKLNCQHIHHAECIKQWLKIKRFCPLCKSEVLVNNN